MSFESCSDVMSQFNQFKLKYIEYKFTLIKIWIYQDNFYKKREEDVETTQNSL